MPRADPPVFRAKECECQCPDPHVHPAGCSVPLSPWPPSPWARQPASRASRVSSPPGRPPPARRSCGRPFPPGHQQHPRHRARERGLPDHLRPGSAGDLPQRDARPEGELLQNYYAIGHVSLDNYIARDLRPGPHTRLTRLDCAPRLGLRRHGAGNSDARTARPIPARSTATAASSRRRADDRQPARSAYPPNPSTNLRVLAGVRRGHGQRPGPRRGHSRPAGRHRLRAPDRGRRGHSRFCRRPTDQYATRHNPFVYFHSIIDNTAECERQRRPARAPWAPTRSMAHSPAGHLAHDFSKATTPKFAFITPNLCDDGHDATCTGTNMEGTPPAGSSVRTSGSSTRCHSSWPRRRTRAATCWWSSPSTRPRSTRGQPYTTACCNEQPGPNRASPGQAGGGPEHPGPGRRVDRGAPVQLEVHKAGER